MCEYACVTRLPELDEIPAATAEDAHCENSSVHVKDAVSHPLMADGCLALCQIGVAKPSPQSDTKCHHLKLEAVLLHPKFHKIHRSSKPIQDIGDGRMTSCPNFPKLRSWSSLVFNLIIYYHLTLPGENADTQNISIRISNCSYTGSNNFPCWKRN